MREEGRTQSPWHRSPVTGVLTDRHTRQEKRKATQNGTVIKPLLPTSLLQHHDTKFKRVASKSQDNPEIELAISYGVWCDWFFGVEHKFVLFKAQLGEPLLKFCTLFIVLAKLALVTPKPALKTPKPAFKTPNLHLMKNER